MSFYEKGAVRIYFEEAGSGFPLLVIPGGGLNSTIAGLEGSSSPFNPMEEFKGKYRCIASDLPTPMAASPPARSRSTGHGKPTPKTSSG
jgi:pimeloyl-ACP methyl ester carboxylesterase